MKNDDENDEEETRKIDGNDGTAVGVVRRKREVEDGEVVNAGSDCKE